MGYAIQSVGLFPHWSVEDNIAAVPRLLGWDEARIAARVTELLALLSMEDERFRKARPAKLSGGQQQRVGVARALAADPEVLLMDEPFGALDPITREGLQAEIARIHRATGKTILFVTHDIDEALALASRVVVLDRGRIVQAASPRELVEAPGSDFVRDFIGRADLGLRRLAVLRVAERMRSPDGIESTPAIGAGESLRTALSRLAETHRERIAVVDEAGTVVGALHLADLVR
jgi:osmoprotectant transport system ATP-binding protein